MYASLRRISSEQLVELQAHPELASRLMDPDDDEYGWTGSWPNAPVLDLDKTWHVLHFLLTGKEWTADPPLGDTVIGGTEIGEDLGTGPARFLTPDQVADVSRALDEVDETQLWSRFDPSALEAAKIYPGAWVRTGRPPERHGFLQRFGTPKRKEVADAEAKMLTEFRIFAKERFGALVRFYREASEANSAILVLIG